MQDEAQDFRMFMWELLETDDDSMSRVEEDEKAYWEYEAEE